MATQTTKRARPRTTRRAPARRRGGAVERGAELSGDVFTAIERAQHSALEAVRGFTAHVDHALPGGGEGETRRGEIVDAALAMSERLVHAQYEFLRSVVRGADDSARRDEP